jgi:hypothetical protein
MMEAELELTSLHKVFCLFILSIYFVYLFFLFLFPAG